MLARTLILFGSLLLGACNDMLDIHAPADQVLDASTTETESQSIHAEEEDAGAE